MSVNSRLHVSLIVAQDEFGNTAILDLCHSRNDVDRDALGEKMVSEESIRPYLVGQGLKGRTEVQFIRALDAPHSRLSVDIEEEPAPELKDKSKKKKS